MVMVVSTMMLTSLCDADDGCSSCDDDDSVASKDDRAGSAEGDLGGSSKRWCWQQ